MNHGSLCLKNTSNQTNTRDLSDISIASVGLARYHEHGMLTDDDDDEIVNSKLQDLNEIIEQQKTIFFRLTQVMNTKMMMMMNH